MCKFVFHLLKRKMQGPRGWGGRRKEEEEGGGRRRRKEEEEGEGRVTADDP